MTKIVSAVSRMIAGCTRVVGKSQGFLGLPIRDVPIHLPQANGEPVNTMQTSWELPLEGIKHLLEGGSLYISVVGNVHPPIQVWTEPPATDEPQG